MTSSASENQKRRWNNVELILIVFGYVILVFLYIVAHRGSFPAAYVLPLNVALIALGGYFAIRIANALLENAVEPTLGITATHAIKNLVQVVVGVVVVTVVFTVLGVNITSILIGAGFLGIVLGLAAQQTLGNIFAGATLFLSKPFEIGDRLTIGTSTYSLISTSYPHETQINGFTGVVQDIGIFFTKVLLDEGTPSVFPNSVVIGALIINHSRVSLRTVRVRVNVDKKYDFHAFEAKIKDSLKKPEIVEVMRCEILDVGTDTYQIAITVKTKSTFEEPIKTMILEEVMKIQTSP